MKREWTSAQQKVIDDRGHNLIVSAAAGSGKTAVLVERIIKKITDREHPTDVDRLLVVTFTNAAAAEMKERLIQAIDKLLSACPEDDYLRRQQLLLNNASIMTIDSFCLKILRNYYQTIGLDPAFRVAEPEELELIQDDVLEELLEDHYKALEDDFVRLVERYESPRKTGMIAEQIKRLHSFAGSAPWPREWIEDGMSLYEVSDFDTLERTPLMKDLTAYIVRSLTGIARMVDENLRLAEGPDGPECYIPILQSDRAIMSSLLKAGSFSELYKAFEGIKFETLSRKNAASETEKIIREEIKEKRDKVKDTLKKIKETFFCQSGEDSVDDIKATAESARLFLKLTLEFGERYAAKKRENNVVDFVDVEHFALDILVDRKDRSSKLTDVALELRSQFDEVMTDEYQDSNYVQESILTAITGSSNDRPCFFTVGDVKQSIYSFRMARPELFTTRYDSFRDGELGCCIDLDTNFRSRGEVLDSVNSVFDKVMHAEIGGVEYDEGARLKQGAGFRPYESAKSELRLIDTTDIPKAPGLNDRRIEAMEIGLRIKELVEKDDFMLGVSTEEGPRPVRYGDIVILLRTMSGWSGEFAEVLSAMKIPVLTDIQSGFFDTLEIQTVLNYLRILDNPLQDIPYVAVLRSAICGLTNEELAELRICGEEKAYFADITRSYLRNGKNEVLKGKLKDFLLTYDELRSSKYGPLPELISSVLDRTGFRDYISALPGGDRRSANLSILIGKAASFEETSYNGLFNYIRYIERLKKLEVDYGEALPGADANAVRIMSVHKSKGLEFPVVFLAGMGKRFNLQDTNASIVAHADYGIGCDMIDLETRTKSSTLIKKAFSRLLKLDSIGEELRVLYVAMTRAKEKLIITATGSKLGEKLEAVPDYNQIASANEFADILLPAVDEQYFSISECFASDTLERLKSAEEEEAENEKKTIQTLLEDTSELPELLALRDYNYSDEDTVRIPTKVSVSFLKHLHMDSLEEEAPVELFEEDLAEEARPEDSVESNSQGISSCGDKAGTCETEHPDTEFPDTRNTLVLKRPRFLGGEEETNPGAALGTLYHLVMQLFPFESMSETDIPQYLQKLVTDGIISNEESERLSLQKLQRFTSSSLASRMSSACKAGKLFREQPFMISIAANRVNEEYDSDKEVIVQGIIDAYFIEDGEIVLMDYKTDAVKTSEELTDKYVTQLEYYSEALSRITGMKVKESIIYSFALGSEIIL